MTTITIVIQKKVPGPTKQLSTSMLVVWLHLQPSMITFIQLHYLTVHWVNYFLYSLKYCHKGLISQHNWNETKMKPRMSGLAYSSYWLWNGCLWKEMAVTFCQLEKGQNRQPGQYLFSLFFVEQKKTRELTLWAVNHGQYHCSYEHDDNDNNAGHNTESSVATETQNTDGWQFANQHIHVRWHCHWTTTWCTPSPFFLTNQCRTFLKIMIFKEDAIHSQSYWHNEMIFKKFPQYQVTK